MRTKPIINMIAATQEDWCKVLDIVPEKERFSWSSKWLPNLAGRPLALVGKTVDIQLYPPHPQVFAIRPEDITPEMIERCKPGGVMFPVKNKPPEEG